MTQIRSSKIEATDQPAESSYSLPVRGPYRLDLTVNVLRRLSTNLVDVLRPDGAYARLLEGTPELAVVRVRQSNPGMLTVELEGDRRDHPRLLALVRRMLGVEVDLTRFYRTASDIQWLHPLVSRMQGVRPPRYPTIWEACVNAIVFQQISLHAASAIMGRLTIGLSDPVDRGGVRLYLFPSPEQFLNAPDSLLAGAGLSAGKLATLRRVADALGTGVLDETQLEKLPSPEATALLRTIKGIGPWTAVVILLRGLGRLDVFPAGDSSVARNLALVGGPAPIDAETLLAALGPDRG
ncbi:MAG TPA: AlkA N-terminal domain-containing protein, partial [Gemmatimonadales bacterium]|nr:AlkA N-terminal domain-containing protein [Gemmatimonadales bacterium]